MFNKYELHKSSIFDLNANIVVLIMWIVTILCNNNTIGGTIVSLAIPFLVLMFETKSQLVRVHAGQIGVLMLSVTIIQTLLDSITLLAKALSSVFGLWILPFTTMSVLFSVFSWIILLVLVLCALFGASSGFHWKEWKVPIIEEFGDILTNKMKRKE